MSDGWQQITATWDKNSEEAKRVMKGNIKNVSISGSADFLGEKTPIDKAINELKDNFAFSDFHEERVRKLFENDESLLDDLNHLVIASSLMVSDATQMTNGGLRAYEMGDKIIAEEKPDDEWKTVRTIGIQVAEILAHARAKNRVGEIEDRVSGLGNDSMDRLDEIEGVPVVRPDDGGIDTDPFGGGGVDPNPFHDPQPPNSGPYWHGGKMTWTTNGNYDDDVQELLNSDYNSIINS